MAANQSAQPIMAAHKEILTSDETMSLLDIGRTFFDRLRKDGILKTYKLGNRVYCKYSEVLIAIDNGLQKADEGEQVSNPY